MFPLHCAGICGKHDEQCSNTFNFKELCSTFLDPQYCLKMIVPPPKRGRSSIPKDATAAPFLFPLNPPFTRILAPSSSSFAPAQNDMTTTRSSFSPHLAAAQNQRVTPPSEQRDDDDACRKKSRNEGVIGGKVSSELPRPPFQT